jgi:acetolactate synthase-1/2/3 large subunit
VAEADVVMFVGSRTDEIGTDAWRAFPAGASYLHIDVDSTEIGRNHEPTVRPAGDAPATCEALFDALERQDLGRRREARPDMETRIADARAAHAVDVSHPTGAQRELCRLR